MKVAQKSLSRLKNMIKQDKEVVSAPLLNMIKSDLYVMINNYFEVYPENVCLKCFVDDDGYYDLQFNIKAIRLKKVKIFGN